jgi:hypothetical protein
MITVVCVFWGNKFSKEYVYNLKASVERNTTVDYKFVCFSDQILKDVETIILNPGQNGWWNKMQLFDGRITGRIVYLDLDTVIVGNIDWLLTHEGKFAGIEDLGSVNQHQPHLKGKLQSGVMTWNSKDVDWIWIEFKLLENKLTSAFRGDGEYLESAIPVDKRILLQRKYPDKIKSYKYDVYPDKYSNVSIICFHGRPSIIQAMTETVKTSMATYEPQSWINKYWRR